MYACIESSPPHRKAAWFTPLPHLHTCKTEPHSHSACRAACTYPCIKDQPSRSCKVQLRPRSLQRLHTSTPPGLTDTVPHCMLPPSQAVFPSRLEICCCPLHPSSLLLLPPFFPTAFRSHHLKIAHCRLLFDRCCLCFNCLH